VTGFLGPNGAGKSTTLRMILGLDPPFARANFDRVWLNQPGHHQLRIVSIGRDSDNPTQRPTCR
jgi:ABC-type multidrug transport system ATPase subunit